MPASSVAFHPKTGQLDLHPDPPAYATQLRLITAWIITMATTRSAPTRCAPSGSGPPTPRPRPVRLGPNRRQWPDPRRQ
ncbi:hypothetical protein ACWY4P_46960 [Streptomyces sp. LZ34]